jgi:hypothetical protein
MLKGLIRFAALVIASFLTGCATFQGAPANLPDSQNALERLDPYYAAVLKDYYVSGGVPVSVRNRFIETRLAVIDAQYLAFKQGLYREGVSSNLAVDVATLGLSLAGTLAPAASTKGILAAISGGLIGTRAAAEKNLYFEKTMPALLAQMEALRKTVRVEILKRMQLSVEAYPLSQAEYDLQEYYTAGTIPGAIVGITMVSVQAENTANHWLVKEFETREAIRKRLVAGGSEVTIFVEDDSSKVLEQFIKPGGKISKDNARVLQSWLDTNHISSSALNFIYDINYAAERKEAIEFLKRENLIQK